MANFKVMIPKTIHYCWFGRGEIPELAKKCIASWHKYLPEYDFLTWRKLRKYFPIEEFNYNPITGSEGQIIVLADYTRGENRYMIINEEDFDNESI